jgi:type II secretory pathway component PulC
MAIKVDLVAGGRIVEVVASGSITRREAGWATVRTREVLIENGASGVLTNCADVEPQVSPTLSAELIEGAVLSLDDETPLAYVRPGSWDAAYLDRVVKTLGMMPAHTRMFDTRETALRWLNACVGEHA